jgi:hypothetical protein
MGWALDGGGDTECSIGMVMPLMPCWCCAAGGRFLAAGFLAEAFLVAGLFDAAFFGAAFFLAGFFFAVCSAGIGMVMPGICCAATGALTALKAMAPAAASKMDFVIGLRLES